MEKRDYYDVLGVGKSASDDEIKKAFRRAAIKHHPDREGGDEEKFKEVSEAYEVLKDPSKRQRYDQFGHAGVGTSAASGGAGGPGFSGFEDIFGGAAGQGFNVDLGDIFSSFFGGQGARQQRPNRGRDVQTQIDVSFEDAIFGTDVKMELSLDDTCEHCKGTTVEPGHELKTCDTCRGSGQVTRVTQTMFGNIQQTQPCQTCQGRGKVPEKVCSVCNGKGTQHKRQEIKLKVPKGIDDGAVIRLAEYGEAMANAPKGDLYVLIRVKPHKQFTREGDLILSTQTIPMTTAILGGEIKVETVDGSKTLKIPGGTQPNTDFRLRGLGVPHQKGDRRGDHIVQIKVEIPKKLSKQQREVLERFDNSPKRWL